MEDDQKAQKFREEQLCAFQTLGNWQKVGFQSYSMHSSLLDQTVCGSTTNSVSSIVDASIAAAITAKNRVLKWQQERSHSLISETTLTQEPSVFKVPLPKPAVTTIHLHDWFFGLRSRNWVLIGRFVDDRGKTRKYTTKSLFDYFERKTRREISSRDRTKIVLLSGPCGQGLFAADIPNHPNFIKEKFRHGFPHDWKEALNSWSAFRLVGEPEDYQWPDHNISANSTGSIVSNFTSVSDRIPQLNTTRKFPIPRNIGVEVDSRYLLNKFLDTTEVGQPNMSCSAVSLSQLPNDIEFSVHNHSNKLKAPIALTLAAINDEHTFLEPQPTAKPTAKVDHNVSRENDNKSETGFVKSPKRSHLDAIEPTVPSNVARIASSCTRQQQASHLRASSSSSSKENHSKSNITRAVQHMVAGSSNQPVGPLREINSKPENISQPLVENHHYKILCGKAIDPMCSFENCVCNMFPKLEIKLTRIDATGSNEKETSTNTKKLVGRQLKHSKLPTEKSSGSTPVLKLQKWWPVISESSAGDQLLLAGEIIDFAGHIVEKCHVSSSVVALKGDIIHTSDGNQYNLVGKLSLEAKQDLPSHIASSYLKNYLFPKHWRKMISEWNITGKKGKKELRRTSTRNRKRPIAYWKVDGGSELSDGYLSDDKLNDKRFNKKKQNRTFKQVSTRQSSKAITDKVAKVPDNRQSTQNPQRYLSGDEPSYCHQSRSRSRNSTRKKSKSEAKVPDIRQHTQNSQSHLSDDEPPYCHLSRSRFQKLTRKKSKKSETKVPHIWERAQNSREHMSEDESSSCHRSRSRSRKSTRIKPKKSEFDKSLPEEILNCSPRLKRHDGSKHSSNLAKDCARSPNSKRICPKRRNENRIYSSEESSDSDCSRHEGTNFQNRTRKSVNLSRKVVRQRSNQKTRGRQRSYKQTSSDESTDVDNCGNELPKRTRTSYQKLSGKSGTAHHSSTQAAGRSVAQICSDIAGTVTDDSEGRHVKKAASIRSGRKAPLYPWESDADNAMDSDSDLPGAQPSERTQNSVVGNTEKVNQNTESRVGSYISQVRMGSAKRIYTTSPVLDSEGLTIGLTKIIQKVQPTGSKSNKNNYDTLRRPVNRNLGNNVRGFQPTSDVCQNVEDTNFDNMSFSHSIVFSETDPRASRYQF